MKNVSIYYCYKETLLVGSLCILCLIAASPGVGQ